MHPGDALMRERKANTTRYSRLPLPVSADYREKKKQRTHFADADDADARDGEKPRLQHSEREVIDNASVQTYCFHHL